MNLVAEWGLAKKLIEPPRQDVRKIVARALAEACRQDFIENEDGEPVRMRHPYRVKQAEKQQVFWFMMDKTTPEIMRLSYQHNRKGLVAEISQRQRDIDYYNKHYNPGDSILPDWNFNADIAEKDQSGEYNDTPPEDDSTDDESLSP